MNELDEREVRKFSELADRWWTGDAFEALHEINPTRVGFIMSHLKSVRSFEPIKLLDIGCGGGILCESLARVGLDITGIDPSVDGIEVAKKHAETAKLKIQYYATDLATFVGRFDGPLYDVVTLMEVVEHVSDLQELLLLSCRLLRKNGLLFISTFNRTASSFFMGICVAEYVLGLVPKGTHKWAKFVRPSEIAEALRLSDAFIVDMKGISFDILKRRWSVSGDGCRVNYILVAKKYS